MDWNKVFNSCDKLVEKENQQKRKKKIYKMDWKQIKSYLNWVGVLKIILEKKELENIVEDFLEKNDISDENGKIRDNLILKFNSLDSQEFENREEFVNFISKI